MQEVFSSQFGRDRNNFISDPTSQPSRQVGFEEKDRFFSLHIKSKHYRCETS